MVRKYKKNIIQAIKPKRLKVQSPNLTQGKSSAIHRSPMNISSKGQGQGHGHKVHDVATRQPCGTFSLLLRRRTTRRSLVAVSSRDDTTVQDCLIQRDRVVGVIVMQFIDCLYSFILFFSD